MIRKHPTIFFICAAIIPIYLILGFCWILGIPMSALKPLKLLFAFTPLLALLVLGRLNQAINLPLIFAKFINRSTSTIWYFLAVLLIPSIGFASLFISSSVFPGSIEWQFSSIGHILGMSIPLLIFPGITEEFGWRGFLYDHFRIKNNLALSGLMVGAVWGIWHSFDFILGNWYFTLKLFASYFIYILSICIILCYLYEKSGQNISIAILTHFSANALVSFTPLWRGNFETIAIFICLLALLALILAYRGGVHPRPYNIPN